MKRFIKKLFLPFIGISSLIWFLIRVIPKPSRATYPCMRVAAPIASTFVTYLIGVFSSVYIFKKARTFLKESRYILYSIMLCVGILVVFGTSIRHSERAFAVSKSLPDGPNQPMGEGSGVQPGRVAWIWNPDVTDETMANVQGDYWSSDENTNPAVVSDMLSQGLQRLTGENTDTAAWDALFKYFNKNHGKGEAGYSAGEKIVIKINLNGFNNSYTSTPPKNINTSPQICYAVLDQLVNVVGVAQADIGIGDPNTRPGTFFNKCKSDFPDVVYWSGNGLPATQSAVFFSSNGGAETPLSEEAWNSRLPQAYVDAAYMINIPVFKKHHRAGISLCVKNHIGSINSYATGVHWCWHLSFPSPYATAEVENGEYGVYRTFVDMIGHRDLGGNTVLYLVDGLWGSTNWGHPPVKWRMSPFNNDWPNSLFLSQDPVAIESVGFDFLRYEFDENHPTEGVFVGDDKGPYPQFSATDDYLHQAADSQNWPEDIIYDPENDGTPLPSSMGAHEHWNNAVDKQYSRNLGLNTGIELASNLNQTDVKKSPVSRFSDNDFMLGSNYPNPFNPSTTIGYRVAVPSDVTIVLYNANGQKVRTLVQGFHGTGAYETVWNGLLDNGMEAPTGIYYYQMTVRNSQQSLTKSDKMLLCR